MIFNPDLLDDLAREKVVLFLGAGVSASAITKTGSRISGWEDFLSDMQKLVPPKISDQVASLLQKKDYLLACEILQTSLSDIWERKIVEEFGQKATPSPLHHAIVGLGQRIIVTTNFDKILETAWETADGKATHYPIVISEVNDGIFRSLKDHSNTYIFKIHGSVDDPTSLVFSRSEYIRLAFGNRSYSSFLDNLLLNYTFLFIGFSMDDPAITSLMEMYTLRYKHSRPHYIIAPDPIESNILDINKKLRKLIFITYDSSDRHGKLPGLIENLGKASDDRKREIFASYTSIKS